MRVFINSRNRHIVGLIIFFFAIGVVFFSFDEGKKTNRNTSKVEIIERMYQAYKMELFPKVAEISPEKAMQLKEESIFVDIRDKREQEVSMLPRAITQEEFENNIVKNEDKVLILYCTIGNRSGKYAKLLSQQGIDSYNLVGGILAWTWEEGRLVDASGQTNKVHVYGSRWNLLPDSYKAVY